MMRGHDTNERPGTVCGRNSIRCHDPALRVRDTFDTALRRHLEKPNGPHVHSLTWPTRRPADRMNSGNGLGEHAWGTRILIDSPPSSMVGIIGNWNRRFQPVYVSRHVTALSCDQRFNRDNRIADMLGSERFSVSLQSFFIANENRRHRPNRRK